MILDEYAMEECKDGHWSRPRLTFYKRSRDLGASMPLEKVPELQEEARQLLIEQIGRRVTFCTQGPGGRNRI